MTSFMDRQEKRENIRQVVEREHNGPLPLSDDGNMVVERVGTKVLVRNLEKYAKLSGTKGG